MYQIDDQLKEFVESPVAVIIGTGDESGCPHVAYGWAPRVHAGRTSLDVFLDTARAGQTIANLETNGRIAVTFAEPVSYRSVQFKGRYLGAGDPDETDRDWVQKGREAFAAVLSLIGDPPAVIKNLWLEDAICIAVSVEQAFDQTPGPNAGRPL